MPDTVVITRPLAQAGPLAALVRASGRPVLVLPLLEIAALEDQGALKAALSGLQRYAMVAFVSPNAIDAAFAHVSAWPAGVTVAVLGQGSRSALATHGVTPANARIVCPADPANSDSEHLLKSLDLAALRGQRVLIVRGDAGRELMAAGLREAGAEVEVVTAYRRRVPALTPPLAATLRQLLGHSNDWIITSSEALRGLVRLLGELSQQGEAVQSRQNASEIAQNAPDLVVKMQQQHLIVPHARIAETAALLGFAHVTLTGSGDERVLAALQLRP